MDHDTKNFHPAATRRAFCTALFLTLVAISTSAQVGERRLVRPDADGSGRRVALVVGNNAYTAAPLTNAVSDGRAVAAALRTLGFDTTELLDANLDVFDRSVEGFIARVQPGDTALFYFSGHGFEIAGENFLLPVDFVTAESETQVKRWALSASDLLRRLEARSPRVRILVLDACRNNPFSGQRSFGTGLAKLESIGTLVAFATAPGTTASDNPGAGNGLFTMHLLEALKTPGVGASELFRRVRERVYNASNGRQVPFLSDGLIGEFYFNASPAVAAAPLPPPVTTPRVDPAPARTNVAATRDRWGYANVPSTLDPDRAKAAAETLVTARVTSVLLNAGQSGLIWAHSDFDLTKAFEASVAGSSPGVGPRPVNRVAYVNVQRVASESTAGRQAATQIKNLQVAKTKELQTMNGRLTADKQRLQSGGSVLSDAGRLTLQQTD
jgi:Caspase domain